MHDCFDDFGEVYFALCKSVGTPYALGNYLRWKYRCYTGAIPPNPAHYDSSHDFGLDYLVYAWPSKAKYNLENLDLKQVALDGFIADETRNTETEQRLMEWMSGARCAPPLIETILPRIQRKISEVLGPCSWLKVLDDCRFGNGASVSLSRHKARFDKKMTTMPLTVSPDAAAIAQCFIEGDPNWASALFRCEVLGPFSLLPEKVFQLTDYNLFDTVPKSLKTDRTIAKEPVLNGFLQQGVHTYLRKRLLRVGIDLRDQSMNQVLASVAQWLGLATLDLSSASNSVVRALIQLLFPHDWYVLLDILRSRHTELPSGEMHLNSMFSSMGNAFTFEVETLIFWAIASAVSGDREIVSVYGDDIICPQSSAGNVVEVLKFFGFRVNTAKSFTEGRFFESCGKHYFDGSDVTPAFQKEAPRSSVAARIRANNRLIRWALRLGYEDTALLHPAVRSACALIRRSPDVPSGPVFRIEQDAFAFDPECRRRVRYTASGEGAIWGLRERLSTKRTRQKAAYAYYLRRHWRGEPRREATLVQPDYFHRLKTVLGDFHYRKTLLRDYEADEVSALSSSADVSEDSEDLEPARVEVRRETHLVEARWA